MFTRLCEYKNCQGHALPEHSYTVGNYRWMFCSDFHMQRRLDAHRDEQEAKALRRRRDLDIIFGAAAYKNGA